MIALFKNALIVAVAATTVAATHAITWHNVTLGEPASALRAALGDPLRVIAFDKDDTRVARYWLPGVKATYFLVIEHRGYVQGFDIFTESAPSNVLAAVAPDPSGIQLGDTLDAVKAKHAGFEQGRDPDGSETLSGKVSTGAGASYGFKNGRVFRIHWLTGIAANAPKLPPITTPIGDAFSTAISDMQTSEFDGVSWEYSYVAFHPCAPNANWQIKNQSLRKNGNRAFDVLHVKCPSTNAERDFYFDISNYFGKL